jgi:hypothetical protein
MTAERITPDEARRLREEVTRLRTALEDAAGPRGSTCTGTEPEMTDAEWMRRQWRNAIDQWQFWHEAYEADIGKPEFVGSWRPWRENALKNKAEVERLAADNGRLRAAVDECLPYVSFDAGYWNENASEGQNRRRQAEAIDLYGRLTALTDGETP